MSAKISNLSEIYSLASNEEKISDGVLGMIGRFDLKRLLKPLTLMLLRTSCQCRDLITLIQITACKPT